MPPPSDVRRVLAPGLRVVRRGRDLLQVGLYDGRRALLPRTPTVEQVLADLLARRPVPEDPEPLAVLETLERSGCLAPDPLLAPVHGPVALLGGWPPERLGTPDPGGLLRGCGLRVTPWVSRAAVVLVLSAGELAREVLDPLLRARTAHVVVRLVDGGAVLGPFVAPGETACLRCVDAHLGVEDPHHVVVTERYVRASGRSRGDGVPDVGDPALAALALAWGVREVGAYLRGQRPAAWSRTLELGAEPSRVVDRSWPRHPECGCCWAAHAPLSGTMEA